MIVKIAERIINDEIPRYVYVGVEDSPDLNEIPTIKFPSVNGLIEVMRGCPRRCKFCSVTLRKLRHYTFDMIERELRVNVEGGVSSGIIHSEDVLLYGSNSIRLNPEKLVKLHELVKRYYKNLAWSHVCLSSVKYAEEEYGLIRKLVEIINQEFIDVEVGIETGSPELARKIMPVKAKPYDVEDWPEIVVDAFSIMHENNIVPAATIILGRVWSKREKF